MKKSVIVCFIGIDGSGKTTHAHALKNKLIKNKGIACKYVWCRWAVGVASIFLFIIKKIFGYTIEELKLMPFQIIFKYLIFFDLSVAILFKVRIPSLFKKCVIIDRYFYDLFADLIFQGFKLSTKDPLVKLMIKMNPKPNLTFFLDVPVEVAISRKNDLSMTEAIKIKRIYNDLHKIYHFKKIVNLDFSEVNLQLYNMIIAYMHMF